MGRVWEDFGDAVLRRAAAARVRESGSEADGSTPPGVELDAELDAARTALHAVASDDPIGALAETVGLDPISLELLALAAAVAWSPLRQRLVGYAQDAPVRGVMVASIPVLLDRDQEAVAAASPDGTLARAGLLDHEDLALGGAAVVTVPATVQWFLVGEHVRDADLPAATVMFEGERAANPSRTLVHGPDRIRRLQAAAELVETTHLLVGPEPDSDGGWAALVRTAVTFGFAIVLEVTSLSTRAGLWIARAPMVHWVVSTRRALPLHELPPIPFDEFSLDPFPARDDEVEAMLGSVPPGHRLAAEQLELLTRIVGVDATSAVRRLATGALDDMAVRVTPSRSWDDLILPPARLALVREVAARLRHRTQVFDDWGFQPVPSTGITALFSGPPGTGKSMAAEVIADDVALDLFRVDLASLVSKYIGETEKNLERVFAAADGAGVVLVFDEADALFGKRTEVSDSHDRYANIETSYLLQRLESFDGLLVLTSNFASNIDDAFLRRIHISVPFDLPDEAERRGIWAASFPKTAPVDEIDLDFLAERFRLSGGSIRAAVLTAAYAAADDGEALAMRHVMHGLRREFQKLGRIITPETFGPWAD